MKKSEAIAELRQLIHHDNVPAHTALLMHNFFEVRNMALVLQPP
jgi:hypothetical protein